jgi:hypothetical protein
LTEILQSAIKNKRLASFLLFLVLAIAFPLGAYLYISSNTKPPRLASCVNALTGTATPRAEVRALTSDVDGRIVVRDGDHYCLNGNGFKVDQGRVEPASASSWNRAQAADFWQENYHSGDNALDINARYPVVENIAIYNTGNVAFGDKAEYITVRNVYVQHAGDDSVESDNLVGATIDSILIDKTFTGLAWRLFNAPCVDNTPNNVVTLRNSIIRLFPQYGMYPGYKKQAIPGYGQVFKWEKDCQYATKLEVRNTIAVANQDGNATRNLNLEANGHLTVSDNNTLVWLGNKPYTGTIPPGWTVTNDPNVFIDAWHKWFADHPQLKKPEHGPDMNYNLRPLR